MPSYRLLLAKLGIIEYVYTAMSKQLTCWLVLLYTTVLFSQEDSISRKVILDSSSFDVVVSVITTQGVVINGDTLLDEISSASSAQMWGYKMNTWEWTQRQSSTLGGLAYNSLDPVLESKADGTYNFLTLDQTMPLSHSANVPLSNLYYRSGFGGGQLFGIQSLSPVDSSQQLYLDYSRMNSLGVYRNEGADGHELNLSLVSNTRLKGTDRFTVSYFKRKTGQNGGLAQPDYFETNIPTLRTNFSVNDPTGEYTEENFLVEFSRNWSDKITASVNINGSSWMASNSRSANEYFWDSTEVTPTIKEKLLFYDDTVGLISMSSKIEWNDLIVWGWNFRPSVSVGLERYYSDVGSWDSFRTDSVNVGAVFKSANSLFLRSRLQFTKIVKPSSRLKGDYHFNVLGYNSGSLDGRSEIIVSLPTSQLSVYWDFIYQSKMYRWEDSYGYSYDFRNLDKAYVKNEVAMDWQHGDKWRYELSLRGIHYNGMRYLSDFSELNLYDGFYGRIQAGVTSNREGWNLVVQGYSASKTGEGGFSIPFWGGRVGGFYATSIGDKFQLRSGFDLSMEDAFYAPDYLGGVPLWSLQQESISGRYPWANVFFEARIDGFVGAVRVVNALEGLFPYTYYAYGTVPRMDRGIQLSAKWTLFN